jgi:hypothetical protein
VSYDNRYYSNENPNANNQSSFMGSFHNLGRPSDMNEDRIYSKEIEDDLLM